MASDVHPYATLAYAKTLAHVGQPRYVSAWRTYVIERRWKEGVADAMGPYPVTCMATDSDVILGLEDLRVASLVSVTLVVDGLLGPTIDQWRQGFSVVRPFKTHYLVDQQSGTYRPSEHHRNRVARAARRGVEVGSVQFAEILDSWTGLYEELIVRRRITGIQRFTRPSFEALARCDGLHAIAAYIGPTLVSCQLWFQYRGLVWSHLAATNAVGYKNNAAFAVYDYSIHNFPGHVIDLGGGAGLGDDPDDGLASFKAGFSNRQQCAYLCGVVLDPTRYESLSAERGLHDSGYFPAYRAPSTAE